MDPMEKARYLNTLPGPEHKNCCQAVLAALAEPLGFDEQTAINLGTCFGGGLMNGEVCGALSGALLYLGLKYGNSPATKKRGRAFIETFRAENGTILCRDLLDPSTGRKNCAGLIVRTVELVLASEAQEKGE